MSSSKTFKYFDELIHSGAKEIILDSDIILDSNEELEYIKGIELDVNNIVIDGNDHTIDANGKARIFKSGGRNIMIKNITLKNGFNEKNGGAIFNTGELNIVESVLTENRADWSGGAVYNHKGNLNIAKSKLSENIATQHVAQYAIIRGLDHNRINDS